MQRDSDPPSSVLKSPTPTRVGRYRLIAHIGQGGMANVFLAVRETPMGVRQRAVLKLLRPEYGDDPDFVAMFLDEARLSARLHHANVVRTHEVDRDGGLYYIAMEFLDGQPLQRVLRRAAGDGGLPHAVALRVVASVLAGLDHAHNLADDAGRSLGVVHRDVSPPNIFVTYDGEVKLVDFGIAKALSRASETRVGTFKGKVGYMPPEQAIGGAIDARADVFAAGVVLFECLAGARLWGDATETAIAAQLIQGRVPDPETRCPELAPEALAILRKAIAADADQRYASARDMQVDVERLLDAQGSRMDGRGIGALVSSLFVEERERLDAEIRSQIRRLDAGQPVYPRARHGHMDGVMDTETHSAITAVHGRSKHGQTDAQQTVVTMHSQAGVGTPGGHAQLSRGMLVFGAVAVLLIGILGTLVVARPESERHEARNATPTVSATELPAPPAGRALPASLAGAASRCDAEEKPRVTLSGELDEDATLGCQQDYVLRYTTVVPRGVTLRIAPGTTLRGDPDTRGTLVVQPGGRIFAEGTPDRPIVFTSARDPGHRAPGDWGGVIILGNAPVNSRGVDGQRLEGRVEGLEEGGRFGGEDEDDSSGVLRYVRIEYSGVSIAPNNEINGLTLGGVGRGTTIDHVQVRQTADDCFEFFGGTVDAKYLICDSPGDDGFDWDLGYRGRLQFLLLRDDTEMPDKTSGFEGDNDPNGRPVEPISAPVIFNATLCGSGGEGRRRSFGIVVRRASRGDLHNLLVSGFHVGLDIRGEHAALNLGHAGFFGQSEAPVLADEGALNTHARRQLRAARAVDEEAPSGVDCRAGRYRPEAADTAGAIAPPDDGFFDTAAAYRGAFRDESDRWDQGSWVVQRAE